MIAIYQITVSWEKNGARIACDEARGLAIWSRRGPQTADAMRLWISFS